MDAIQVRVDLPGLEDLLDLGDERGGFGRPERVLLGDLKEVEKPLPDQIPEGLLQAEPLPDISRRLALLDPLTAGRRALVAPALTPRLATACWPAR